VYVPRAPLQGRYFLNGLTSLRAHLSFDVPTAAPEVVENEDNASARSDVWSLACTIIELMTGAPPYFALGPMVRINYEDRRCTRTCSCLTLVAPYSLENAQVAAVKITSAGTPMLPENCSPVRY